MGRLIVRPMLAHRLLDVQNDIKAVYLREGRAGQLNALQTGLTALDAGLVAVCDADTWYPPHYLALAQYMLECEGEDVAAAMAIGLSGQAAKGWRSRLKRLKTKAVSSLLPRQCHTGGYGQCFRTGALIEAGGYNESYWPYVLYDHELIHRITKIGKLSYHADLWCVTKPRRGETSAVRWTVQERLMYHLTPHQFKDWLFYIFLARRFEARGLYHVNIRARVGEDAPGSSERESKSAIGKPTSV